MHFSLLHHAWVIFLVLLEMHVEQPYLHVNSLDLIDCGGFLCVKSIGISSAVDEAYSRLTTRQPESFWTSGQWMTERRGGSDVGE